MLSLPIYYQGTITSPQSNGYDSSFLSRWFTPSPLLTRSSFPRDRSSGKRVYIGSEAGRLWFHRAASLEFPHTS